jgi:hypothetical protein
MSATTIPADLIARVDGLGPRAMLDLIDHLAEHFSYSWSVDGIGKATDELRAELAVESVLIHGRDALTDPYFVGGVA